MKTIHIYSRNSLTLIAVLCATVFCVAIFGACSGPLNRSGKGIIRINLGNSGARSIPTDEQREKMIYTITLTKGGEKIERTLKQGVAAANISVSPGVWKIAISAYLDGEFFATGSGSVNVTAGKTSDAKITMRQVPPNEFLIDSEWIDSYNTFSPINQYVHLRIFVTCPGDQSQFDVDPYIESADIEFNSELEKDQTSGYNKVFSANLTYKDFTSFSGLSEVPVTIKLNGVPEDYESPVKEITINIADGLDSAIPVTRANIKAFNDYAGEEGSGLFYQLAENIDLSETVYSVDWPPIGTIDVPFQGNFDGNNKTISGLTINAKTYYQGLFGVIDSDGIVKNLGLIDVNINNTRDDTGGVAGQNKGSVTNCYITGKVNGVKNTGGVVGNNSGTVENCHATGSVNAEGYDSIAGGVVGQNGVWNVTSSGTVEHCHYSGTVTANGQYGLAGGVVGRNDSLVKNCYTVGGDIKAGSSNEYAGGVVGGNFGTVQYCFAHSDVESLSGGAGGVVGSNNSSSKVQYSYAVGTVTISVNNAGSAGGVVGANSDGTVENCYSESNVKASSDGNSVGNFAGGVVGRSASSSSSSIVQFCYATGNVEVSGSGYAGGIMGQNNSGNTTIERCVALNKNITIPGSSTNYGRIVGDNSGNLVVNYARSDMQLNDEDFDLISAAPNPNAKNGGSVYDADSGSPPMYNAASDQFWIGSTPASTMEWDSDVWELGSANIPILKGFEFAPPEYKQNPAVQK